MEGSFLSDLSFRFLVITNMKNCLGMLKDAWMNTTLGVSSVCFPETFMDMSIYN